MKFRPIINQTKFSCYRKETIFNIKRKKSQSKIKHHTTHIEQLKSFKKFSQKQIQIQDCLQSLKITIQQQKSISDILYNKIYKLFKQLQKKYRQQDQKQSNKQRKSEDFENISLLKLSSRLNFKSRQQLFKNKQNNRDGLYQTQIGQSPSQPKLRKQSTKLRAIMKQQDKKHYQDMIKELQEKNLKLEDQLKENYIQIQKLKLKIDEVNLLKYQIQQNFQKQIKKFQNNKIQYLAQINQVQQEKQQILKIKQMILSQLQQRQTELISLWQMKLQLST